MCVRARIHRRRIRTFLRNHIADCGSMLTDTILIHNLILVQNRKSMHILLWGDGVKTTVWYCITRLPVSDSLIRFVSERKRKSNPVLVTKDCGSRVSAACPALLPEGILSNLDVPSWDGVKQRFCVFPGEWEIHSVYQGMMGKNQDWGESHQWENK